MKLRTSPRDGFGGAELGLAPVCQSDLNVSKSSEAWVCFLPHWPGLYSCMFVWALEEQSFWAEG